MAHIDVRDLGRVSIISAVLTKHGFGSVLQASGLMEYATEEVLVEDSGGPWAVRLRRVLTELGPTFVKLGQVLSVRPDIVPANVMREFAKLQDEVPPMSWVVAKQVLEQELECPVEEVFQDIDPVPVASASIAQVHFATLMNGDPVAVKVQRVNIGATVRSDVHILYSLARMSEGRLEIPGLYTPAAIVREFELAIAQEMDFLQEARNLERFREIFREDEWVVVPRVYRRMTSSRVLVMDRVAGIPLSAIEDGDGRLKPTLHRLVDASVKQIFDHGFFHADPHPGNILLTEDGRLAFLDFGLCGVLTHEMRDTLVTVLVSLVFQDAETLSLSIYRSGGVDGRVDLKAFRGEIERLMQKYHGSSLADLGAQASLLEFVQTAGKYRIRLVPEYALLARACSIIDGILRSRLPGTDPVELVRPHARRLMAERLSPERVGADLARSFVQTRGAFTHLPTQVNQLLMDLEGGNLRFVIEDPAAPLGREETRNAAFRLSLVLWTSAVMISGAVLLAAWNPAPWGVPLMGIFGLMLVALASCLWLGLVIHTLAWNHIRLREWRRRARALWRFFAGS